MKGTFNTVGYACCTKPVSVSTDKILSKLWFFRFKKVDWSLVGFIAMVIYAVRDLMNLFWVRDRGPKLDQSTVSKYAIKI